MVVMQSPIRKFSNSLCPTWKDPGRAGHVGIMEFIKS
jgi:hypothetical protein